MAAVLPCIRTMFQAGGRDGTKSKDNTSSISGIFKSFSRKFTKWFILMSQWPRICQIVTPGEGNSYPPQYSCLENPIDRGAWWVTVHGFTQSWTWLKWLSTHSTHISLGVPKTWHNGISFASIKVGISELILSIASEVHYWACGSLHRLEYRGWEPLFCHW